MESVYKVRFKPYSWHDRCLYIALENKIHAVVFWNYYNNINKQLVIFCTTHKPQIIAINIYFRPGNTRTICGFYLREFWMANKIKYYGYLKT